MIISWSTQAGSFACDSPTIALGPVLPLCSARSEMGDRRPSPTPPCPLHPSPRLAAFCNSHPWAGSRLLSRMRHCLGDCNTLSFLIFLFSFPSHLPPGSFALSRSPYCNLTMCLPYVYSLCLAQRLPFASSIFKLFLPRNHHWTLPIDISALYSYMDGHKHLLQQIGVSTNTYNHHKLAIHILYPMRALISIGYEFHGIGCMHCNRSCQKSN